MSENPLIIMNATINLYDPEASGIVEFGFVDSPFGKCLAAFNSQGLCQLEFIEDSREAVGKLRSRWSQTWVNHNGIFDGLDFSNFLSDTPAPFPLCLHGTAFQVEVWKTLLGIPFGKVVTYGDVASKMGRPKSVRAVASAIAANPLAAVIPCHRVIRGNGDFGQYRWGSERKREIINWERKVSHARILISPHKTAMEIRHKMAASSPSL